MLSGDQFKNCLTPNKRYQQIKEGGKITGAADGRGKLVELCVSNILEN